MVRTEWVPWYREKTYNGNITEEEKRYLDSFRNSAPHPAAKLHALPEEVQSYVSELELAHYDLKQESAIKTALGFTGLGVFIAVSTYYRLWGISPYGGYSIAIGVIAAAWLKLHFDWKRNVSWLWMETEGDGVPLSRTQEAIQRNWELEEVMRYRKSKKRDAE